MGSFPAAEETTATAAARPHAVMVPFAAIDDGLPPSDADATQDVPALCHSVRTTCLPRFKALLAKLDEEADSNMAD
uniref:Uncharacterized protein n=1 Tax=Oryza rufipogon TaxID=4529 RepID=A0A0E0P7B3_ORYRU